MVNCVQSALPIFDKSILIVKTTLSILQSLIAFLCSKATGMKNELVLFAGLFIATVSTAQNADNISLIPQPVSLTRQEGSFVLPANPVIEIGEGNSKIASWLAKKIVMATGRQALIKHHLSSDNGVIRFIVTNDKTTHKEQYILKSGKSGVAITASDSAGLFYGVQTLLQLLPAAIENKNADKSINWTMPAVEIDDYPRFGWRGLMFDVSRHFF